MKKRFGYVSIRTTKKKKHWWEIDDYYNFKYVKCEILAIKEETEMSHKKYLVKFPSGTIEMEYDVFETIKEK